MKIEKGKYTLNFSLEIIWLFPFDKDTYMPPFPKGVEMPKFDKYLGKTDP